MSEDEVMAIVGWVLFVILCVEATVGICLIISVRDTPHFRARQNAADALFFICILLGIARSHWLVLASSTEPQLFDCLVFVWTGSTMFMPGILAPLIKAWRLLLIFHATSLKFQDIQAYSSEMKKLRILEKMRSDMGVVTTFFIVFIISLVLPVISTIYALTRENYIGDSDDCRGVVYRIFMVPILPVLVLFVFLAIKLRKVHDAFWVKREIKALGVLALLTIPAFISVTLSKWGFVANYLVYAGVMLISWIMPSLVALKRFDDSSCTASMNSKKSISIDEENSTVEGMTELDYLLGDPSAVEAIEEYMLHFQLVDMGHLLIFLIDIRKFQQAPVASRTGIAWLMYQKYLDQNAYLQIDQASEENAKAIKDEIEDKMKGAAETIGEVSATLFNDIKEAVEEVFVEEVFNPFLASSFHRRYQKANSLKKGLETV